MRRNMSFQQTKRTQRTKRNHRTKQNYRRGLASLELVMASAVAIPIAGGLLFLGFQICRYVFSALNGLLTMPFV